MEPQLYIVLIGAVSRAISLAIAGVGGIICIYFGWQLYREGIKVATSGSVENKQFKVKLTTTGPGVFLVLFGAGILVHLIGNTASFTMPETLCEEKLSGTGASQAGPMLLLHAAFDSARVERPLARGAASPPSKPARSAAQGGTCKPCRVWAMTFLDGAPAHSEYKAALDKSLELLAVARQEAQEKEDIAQVELLRDQIDRLRELRGGLNEQ